MHLHTHRSFHFSFQSPNPPPKKKHTQDVCIGSSVCVFAVSPQYTRQCGSPPLFLLTHVCVRVSVCAGCFVVYVFSESQMQQLERFQEIPHEGMLLRPCTDTPPTHHYTNHAQVGSRISTNPICHLIESAFHRPYLRPHVE